MKTIIALLFLISYSLSFSLFAEEEIPLWQKEIIQETNNLFSPLATKEFGKKFKTIIVSNNSASGAADHTQDELLLKLYTGLLKSSRLTPDSLRMLICHEIGHLFGGAPRKNIPYEWDGPVGQDGRSLLSSEGQADYYASAVCFRRLAALDKKPFKLSLNDVGPNLKKKCAQIHNATAEDLNLCYRTAIAGKDFLNLVHDFDISTEKQDDSIAENILFDVYPDRQCRLDTIIHGALCKPALSLALNEYDHLINECQIISAKRPKCWYVAP